MDPGASGVFAPPTNNPSPRDHGRNLHGRQTETVPTLHAGGDRQSNTDDEDAILLQLTSNIQDQDELERDITSQAKAAFLKAESEKDQDKVHKLTGNLSHLTVRHDTISKQLGRPVDTISQRARLQDELDRIAGEIRDTEKEIAAFESRIQKRLHEAEETAALTGKATSQRLPGETRRDFLLRTGKITPFASLPSQYPDGDGFADDLTRADEEAIEEQLHEYEGPTSHRILSKPGFSGAAPAVADARHAGGSSPAEPARHARKKRRAAPASPSPDSEYDPDSPPSADAATPASVVAAYDSGDEEPARPSRRKVGSKPEPIAHDDGNEKAYMERIADWVRERRRARRALLSTEQREEEVRQNKKEWLMPDARHPSLAVNDAIRIPGDIHPVLFAYQKVGIEWLTELYQQRIGGIIADEMGLGKTVQVIAFISALHHSGMFKKPVIIVTPATLLQQWVNEFHKWWPALRVSILHNSGSGMQDDGHEDVARPAREKSPPAARRIVDRILRSGHVLVTTYSGLTTYRDLLLGLEWGYVVLDEGHKIRNPDAHVTLACKELRCPHRIILSGTPIQNNLSELWSLFDFILPLRLGTMYEFRKQFETPIRVGGYKNASTLEIMTAENCAEALKATIGRYILQRLKVDVAADLPRKREQVLFCKLTATQREEYHRYLESDDVSAMLANKRRTLAGIDTLRKICNHPDLLCPDRERDEHYDWASPQKSAKLEVTRALIGVWKKHGHKTLVFSQGKLMLNIIEAFLQKAMPDVNYLRMDGETDIDKRQAMIDRFNTDPSVHLFILTTRTGGLGTNLTGASRIIIFDPDWNPSTDMQARERAWRLGQDKEVTIYRLMTTGTIEEKIHRRQIFKQFLSSKVLKDPKQRGNFALSDLYDLFAPLGNDAGRTEDFDDARVEFGGREMPPGREMPATGLTQEETAIAQKLEGVAAAEDLPEDPEADSEKRMVDGIFSRTVDRAYEHDRIVTPGRKIQYVATPSELRDAARYAGREAAAFLRRTDHQEKAVAAYGGAHAHRQRVLANHGLRVGAVPDASKGSPASGMPRKVPSPADFERMIRDFVDRKGGRAEPKEITTQFARFYTSENAIEFTMFTTALNKIAQSNKSKNGSRYWSLKK